ncbi:relaxase/mobilization nuclease domain-containing protein [Pseudonocardia broussonetiae]|uniref:Mobilization protein n=1 Tax=Pseudonocardia broussonetiae TaxID=2736640 RepID=A0A6M6JKM4_9PSEU|nr:relaxase/mobilization nuclease domain-containing protein [Pseudonocardia broussonetiae]QJY47785.1 mobilization protein [Pseudonocardia broussonetiae]
MITKVVHGWRPAGLLAYLLGPGTAEVHRSPRVIASWDGLDAGWQPERTGPSEYDLRLGPLVDALHAPAVAAGLPTRAPRNGSKRGYVWHCSARLAASDRTLSDGQWADIARELLDGAGIAERGDPGEPRWVVIRHADDHIHIAVVLVRQDTGRRFWPHHDYPKLRSAARAIEQRLGLTVTAVADDTAARRPGRGETEKAARRGRGPARPELRRAAQQAAIRAGGPEEFVAELRAMGYLAELRRGPSGDALGYRIGRAGDVTAAGQQVFYSGSKLAPDLSLPQLRRRWAQNPDRPGLGGRPLSAEAEDLVVRARVAVGARDSREGVDGIVHATGDVLTALAANDRGHKRGWWDAAERYERASRPPGGRVPDVGPVGAELRLLARRLLAARGFRGKAAVGSVALAIAVAGLLQEVAAWQRQRGREHQAAAADAAGARLQARHVRQRDPDFGSAAVQGSGRERAGFTREPGSAIQLVPESEAGMTRRSTGPRR